MAQDIKLIEKLEHSIAANKRVDTEKVWVSVQKTLSILEPYFVVRVVGNDDPIMPPDNSTVDDLVLIMQKLLKPKFLSVEEGAIVQVNDEVYINKRTKVKIATIFINDDDIMVKDTDKYIYYLKECYKMQWI